MTGIKSAIKEAFQWVIVLAAGLAALFFFDDIRSLLKSDRVAVLSNGSVQPDSLEANDGQSGFDRSVHLRAERNGHFFTNAHINGRSVPVLVDTGATLVSLRYEDAADIGLQLHDGDFKYATRTANGMTRSALVVLDRLRIGNISVRNVKASVGLPGRNPITLLGMSFLGKLKSVDLRGKELVLTQ